MIIKMMLVVAAIIMLSCDRNTDLEQCDKFEQAVAVWSAEREEEQNLTLSFREVIECGSVRSAYVRLTASCDYRMRVNGEFVAHGPSVAAHDFYRVDCYDIAPYLREGKNLLAIEVAGYNQPSYYLLDQPSFLQAEVEVNGRVVAATGADFVAYDLKQRVSDVARFSFQRTYGEEYNLAPDFDAWATDVEWQSNVEAEVLTAQPVKSLLPRGVAYPDYKVHDAELIADNIYKFATNSSGFLAAKVVVSQPTRLKLRFDELLGEDGRVSESRMRCRPYVIYNLGVGEYSLESFEPYTMQYVEVVVESGECSVERIYMRDYCNSDCHRATFESSSKDLNFLFEAARRNYRQNALDVYMDCPGRERAGWLCDSYFTARVEFDMSGASKIEHNFLENFLLPTEFKDIDKGMLPMCYPADHRNHNYIPNWAMWYVLELEEYLHRTGDRAMVDRAKERIYDLVDYFKPYLNEDGLLERLDKWVFVDYSFSNKCVQDISYPSNMLYAKMLDTVARLYGDTSLAEQAAHIRDVVRRDSYNGEFFVDNAVPNEKGYAVLTDNITESCQYYAFFCDVATPESHPELWRRLRDDFHPKSRQAGAFAEVHPANAFVGGYLRFELLSKEGLSKQILNESIATYMAMAECTGTLWEFFKPKASCNHGFASHLAHTFYRDVLGVYDVAPCEKVVRLRMIDSGLEWCKGSIPVGEESIDMSWSYSDGEFDVELSLPQGYRYEIIPTEYKVVVE